MTSSQYFTGDVVASVAVAVETTTSMVHVTPPRCPSITPQRNAQSPQLLQLQPTHLSATTDAMHLLGAGRTATPGGPDKARGMRTV